MEGWKITRFQLSVPYVSCVVNWKITQRELLMIGLTHFHLKSP